MREAHLPEATNLKKLTNTIKLSELAKRALKLGVTLQL